MHERHVQPPAADGGCASLIHPATAGDDVETLLEGYPWLEREDVLAYLAYAHRPVQHRRVEPLIIKAGVMG